MARKREIWNVEKTIPIYLAYHNKVISVPVEKRYSTFPSESTSGYPDRISMHPLHAYRSREKISYKRNYIRGKLSNVSAPPDQYLDGFSSSAERGRFIQSAINAAIEDFMHNKQQLAADFAQRQKTIDMVTTRLVQAVRILRDLKRFKLLSAFHNANGRGPRKKLSKRAANVWLEYQYGWKPLVGSIYTIIDEGFPPLPERYTRKTKHANFDRRAGNMVTYGYARATVSFLAQLTSPVGASATKLGLINPASVAWEVVPFSFVVDWFYPVSTWLSSLDAFHGFRIIDKSMTLTQVLVQSNDDGLSRRDKISRAVERQLQFNLSYRPYLKSPLSTVHALNAFALIRSLKDK